MTASAIKLPSPKAELDSLKKQVKAEGKKQLKEISKTAVSMVEDEVGEIDIGAGSVSDAKKFIDSLKKGDILAATSIAMDSAIIAATASLGGVGALFGAAIVGLKHLFEGMIKEPTRDEISKRDLGYIVEQFLYPSLKNIPDTTKELSGYKNAYKLTYPVVDSTNFLFGFLRTEFYTAILKAKKALPSVSGTYPKQHEVKYAESWKIYSDIIKTTFYKLFPYPENKLIYPSDALVKKIKDAKTLSAKLALIPYNELWFWESYWNTKDPGFKDRALGTSYSVEDNPPASIKKFKSFPIYDKSKTDVIYSSETGLPIASKKIVLAGKVTDLVTNKDKIQAAIKEEEEKKKKAAAAKKKEEEEKEKKKKAAAAKEKEEKEKKKKAAAAKEKEEKEKKKKIDTGKPLIHQNFVLWAALGLPLYV